MGSEFSAIEVKNTLVVLAARHLILLGMSQDSEVSLPGKPVGLSLNEKLVGSFFLSSDAPLSEYDEYLDPVIHAPRRWSLRACASAAPADRWRRPVPHFAAGGYSQHEQQGGRQRGGATPRRP